MASAWLQHGFSMASAWRQHVLTIKKSLKSPKMSSGYYQAKCVQQRNYRIGDTGLDYMLLLNRNSMLFMGGCEKQSCVRDG